MSSSRSANVESTARSSRRQLGAVPPLSLVAFDRLAFTIAATLDSIRRAICVDAREQALELAALLGRELARPCRSCGASCSRARRQGC